MSHSLLSCSTLSCEFPERKETSVIQAPIQNWPICTLLCQKQVKLQPNSRVMLARHHFLGELGLLTLLFEACNHIVHEEVSWTLSICRVEYTCSDVPVQRAPGAIHSQPHSLPLIMD